MPPEPKADSHLEIAHVLFADIVGYSKLLSNEQRELSQLLNEIVRSTQQFRNAEAAGKLVRLPTGDGMALAFFTSPDAPVRCAQEISRRLREHPELRLRMGINSGPVDHVSDVNDRRNVTGAGINLAQRVMDCGDAGHILVARRVAEDLAQSGEWQPRLHDLGDVEVKHGVRVHIANLYGDRFGNPAPPEKITRVRLEREAAARTARKRKRRRVVIGASSGVLLLLAIGIASWAWQRRAALTSAYKLGAAGIVEKSIAVLPFENAGDDKENAYLADGVQDEILTDLTKLADLKVISRRSVAQYRDTKATTRQIGQALQVAHVLEGTVRKVADRIHVTAQLIDTRSEAQTWADNYDSNIADAFQIQSDISQAIVSHLKVALSPVQKAAIEAKPTGDNEAYNLYLRARALIYGQASGVLSSAVEENATKAIPLLESAIARDGNFALAYCALADAHLIAKEDDKAKQATDLALRIAPDSGEAHLIRAKYLFRQRDISGRRDNKTSQAVEKELTIAAAALPGRVDILDIRAALEQEEGKWKQALADRQKAHELDPQNLDTTGNLAFLHILLRNYSEAERLLDQILAATPQQITGTLWRYKTYIALARGDTNAAMAAMDSNPARNTGLYNLNHLRAHVFLMERNYERAEEIVRSATETAKKQKVWAKVQERNEVVLRAIDLEKRGRIARFQGDKEKARKYFEAARPLLQEWLERDATAVPPDPAFESYASAYTAEIDAALGRKDDAIREGRDVAKLWPFERDPIVYADIQIFLAVVYMWSSERDAALQQLAELAKVPVQPPMPWLAAALSAGDLKLNPLWDELRSDPRFGKIIVEAAKPVKID